MPPAEALKTFELPKGWVIELIAAEPLVVDPVAIAWDERGRMFVAEMRDYPNSPEKLGRIKLLTDEDGDGRMDKSIVFADELPFANGILPYRGGLLVTTAPDIVYLKDSDGDGKADVREVVVTGFTRGNQQLLVNGLRYGLDNWIYGANGRSNGSLRFPDQPESSAIALTNTDFRFRLDGTRQLEPASGFSQFGLSFDEWGNRFISWNTMHIRHVVIERPYLQRNPHFTLTDPTAHIADADHGDAGRVYQISRPQENFHSEPGGYFNATSGIEVDRGGIFPPPYAGSAFVGEPLRNIVHRDELVPDGATFIARRGEQEQDSEFLASTDPWFRPVNMATGPDGALYIADFYREWIEHPDFVPDAYEEGIDFYNGTDRGRIYRVRPLNPLPPGEGQGVGRSPHGLFQVTDLSKTPDSELVMLLGHPSGWHRDTAKRLLLERGNPASVPALEKVALEHPSPHARAYAIRTLEGLARQHPEAELVKWLRPEIVEQASRDAHPRVREHALPLLDQPPRSAWFPQIVRFADDPDARVRFQAALAMGNAGGQQIAEALVKIARRDLEDPWTRAAVLTSLGGSADAFLQQWLAGTGDKEPSAGEVDLLREVAQIAAGQAGSISPELASALDAFRVGESVRGLALLAGLAEGWSRSGQSVREKLSLLGGAELANAWTGIARRTAPDNAQPLHGRVLAVQLLAMAGQADDASRLIELIAPQTPAAIQEAVITALSRSADPQVPGQLLDRWSFATGPLRRQILSAMLTNNARVDAVLSAIENARIAAAEIEAVPRYYLTHWPDATLRQRAEKLFKSDENRQAVIDRFQPALTLAGDASRGEKLFTERTCITCHRVRGQGGGIGPDLSAVATRPPRQLVEDILDPNRQVSPDFISYMAATNDGQVYVGTIATETASQITLRQADGREAAIARGKITTLQSTGRSLMPDGLEAAMTPQDLADLIAFLRGG